MKYRMFSGSVLGPKYAEKGWKCQDSSGSSEFGNVQMIAVADGHGSPDCFRSEYGSAAAIQSAFRQSRLFCESACENLDIQSRFSETGIINFKYAVWEEWRHLVRQDWDRHLKTQKFFGEGEPRFTSVSDKYKARFTSEDSSVVERYLYSAYGSTLMLAVSIGTQILILQIGDGTCVILQRDGEFRTPVPLDDENFLNVTTSLCDDNADLKMRHAIVDSEADSMTAPVAVFLSTDGVDDCYPIYRNKYHLYKLYSIILENMIKSGYKATETEIKESLLPGMTQKSSQDDLSLAYFVTEDLDLLQTAYDRIDTAYKPPAETEVTAL